MPGWTSGTIAPNKRVHDASQIAVTQASAPRPQSVLRPNLASQVLRNPSATPTVLPPGTPVGSASVSANNGDIPPAVTAAFSSFQNSQNQNFVLDMLNKVLGGFNAPAQPTALNPIQEQYLQSKTALNNQALQTAQLPGRLSQQINSLEAQRPAINPFVISPMGTYAGGNAARNIDQQLQGLYGERTNAQRQSGWLPQY